MLVSILYWQSLARSRNRFASFSFSATSTPSSNNSANFVQASGCPPLAAWVKNVIAVSISPKSKGDSEKMGVALSKMIKEDPSFVVETDEDSGETIIKGMGELHLEVKVELLRTDHGVEVVVGRPQVAYRETISKSIRNYFRNNPYNAY